MKILKIGNSLIFGVEHYNMNDVKKVFNYVKKSYKPEDRVVFMGEGGDDNNAYEKGGEQEEIKNKLENYFTNFINDSWDGKETNVLNPNSYLFKEISSRTGLSRDKTMAAVYVIIVGQTRIPEEMIGLLTKEGENWIRSFDIKNPKNPSNEDMDLMYDLCFPQDTNNSETEMSKITDIFNEVRDENLLKKIKNYHKNGYTVIATVGEGHIDLLKNTKLKKVEAKETDCGSSGSFEGPLFGKSDVIKRPISKIPNMDLKEEAELKEVTAGDAGQYDVPLFGKSPKGRRNPLKIDGPKSIYKGRAVTDKNFPKWGGPDSVFVKVKEKCKKFPYCNQGDTGAIEFIHEDDELQESIKEISKKYGILHKDVENIVLNEINKIFI
jgi:hypothetical protein